MRPKPMLDIGEKPMLLHIMACYGRFGFRRFVLCTGHRSEVISDYFANFAALNSDYTVDLAGAEDQLPPAGAPAGVGSDRGVHRRRHHDRRPAGPGGRALSGRSAAFRRHLRRRADRRRSGRRSWRFHLGHDRLGTVLGVQPPSQFGRLALHEDGSASFTEKPRPTNDMVNGGFFFFRRGFLDYLSTDEAACSSASRCSG